jgi:hypothetical protein
VFISISAFIFGLVFCVLAYFTSHGTQLALYNEAILNINNPVESFIEKHRTWLAWARTFCILSVAAFLVGALVGVLGLVGGIHCSVGAGK